jgi:Family of unknown function (DUF6166)
MASRVAYVGIRGPQSGYGHGAPRIVGVVRDEEKQMLTLADERYLREESFEWGYDGGGPALLAQAILNDYLGIEVDLIVARTFMGEVIAHLPSEFDSTGNDVAQWLSERLASSLRDEARASL